MANHWRAVIKSLRGTWRISCNFAVFICKTFPNLNCLTRRKILYNFTATGPLKGPKHDQVGCAFFYIKQTRMVRWLGDWRKKLFLFLFGEDILHFVFLANAEHTLKIIKRTISVRLTFFSVCSAYAQRKLDMLKRMLSIICRNFKKRYKFKLTLSVR